MKTFLLLLLILMASHTHAQIITTFAGNGTMAVTGDGGPATAASLYLPHGIAVDASGNVYDGERSHLYRKTDAAGIIHPFAGGLSLFGFGGDGGPATAARIRGSYGIAISASGNIYLTDEGNYRIRKVDASGIISTVAGNGSVSYTGDGSPATDASFRISDIAVDRHENLYILDGFFHVIRKVDHATGIISTIAGTGIAGYSGDGGPATAAMLNGPEVVTVDSDGNIYIADSYNYRVRRINTLGIIATIAGTGIRGFSGDGGPATAAMISLPHGLLADDAGDLYICDAIENNRIRKIDTAGTITTFVGTGGVGSSGDGGPATAAELWHPRRITRYGSGPIYFTDRQNNRIRVITFPNHVPYFNNGDTVSAVVCSEFLNLDTLLAVIDSDGAQPMTWSLLAPPAHGIASVSYTGTSTGGLLYPSGLSYIPAIGYTGTDTFTVRIGDGVAADTIMVCLQVLRPPTATTLSGADTVCIGITSTITAAQPGGTWAATGAAAVSSAGVVSGLSVGTAVITYTITNPCGSAATTHTLYVKGCPDDVGDIPAAQSHLIIYPNPGSGSFTIYVPGTGTATLSLIDASGKKVKSLTAIAGNTILLPADVLPGSYMLHVTVGDSEWMEKVTVVR